MDFQAQTSESDSVEEGFLSKPKRLNPAKDDRILEKQYIETIEVQVQRTEKPFTLNDDEDIWLADHKTEVYSNTTTLKSLEDTKRDQEKAIGVPEKILDGSCTPWKCFVHEAVLSGVRRFASLYDRQLRHRVAAFKLSVSSDRGTLESELQLHSAQTAALLSSALRLQDALLEVEASAVGLQTTMQQMYPGCSAVEPARGMERVQQMLCKAVTAPLRALQQLIEALQLHCDRTVPAVQTSVTLLEQQQETYLQSSVDLEDEEKLLEFSRGPKKSEMLHKIKEAEQQSGYLWDSLRVKLQRLVEQLRGDLEQALRTSRDEC